VNLTELVKVLRIHRRQKPLPRLSAAAEDLLATRILASEWYAHEPFLELLRCTDEVILGRSEARALEMGILGGHIALQGPHRAFVQPGDPEGSMLALRHVWRSYFDFGELAGEPEALPHEERSRGVRFILTGYPDIPCVHAHMTAGWPMAAAQIAGARDPQCEMLERPWKGAQRLVFRVLYRG
jgi:hypothetical protein